MLDLPYSTLPLFSVSVNLTMRAVIYLTLSALAALVAASSPNAFKVPNGGYSFKTGSPTTLNWDPTTEGPVTLKLFSGTVMKPEDGVTIACK